MKKLLLLALVLNLCPFLKGQETSAQILSDGVQEAWVARHKESGSSNEYAQAMAVDPASGDIYVTGYSDSLGRPGDYLTVKYNAAGVRQWTARYNGQGNGDDRAVAVAADSTGNVYITGKSTGLVTGYDFVTIKYNSAGAQVWVATYNGNWHDYAVALGIDPASGEVYVTGYGESFDYATVKYNSAGTQQWVQTIGGGGQGDDYPVALVVDDASNVYVTGTRGTNYYTVKYNSAGTKQWATTYNGNWDDYARALAVDAAGNVYVAGTSSTYSSYSSYFDYATVKYNSAGQTQWVARYNGTGNSHDEAKALGIDAAGNIYVTGFSIGANSSYDYATIKYNSVGQEQWVTRYNTPVNNFDVARALGIDAAGNIYVTGYSWNGTNDDYATVKYDAAGAQEGVATYNGPGNGNDQAVALAVDGKGNTYVTGSSVGAGTGYDFATIKYTGNLLANAGPDKEICSGQSVTLGGNPTASGGAKPYTYSWTPTTGLNDPTAPNPIATSAATTEYTVEVADASGAKATDKIVVTAKPCAVTVFPAPNALNVNKAANLAFTFANPIDPAMLNNSTIRVNGAQSGLHTSSNITYDSGTRKATFDPASDFKPGEVVNVTLTTGIKNISGTALASPYSWSFTIQAIGGSGVFAKVGNIAVGSSPISTTAGDFDGDGDLDLAVANRYSGNLSILKNGGRGVFVPSSTPTVGSEPYSVAAGDFDGDSDLDLAVANRVSGNVSILKNSGNGAFTPSSTPKVKSQPYSVTAGDFDGDGDLDLAVANYDSGAISILKNNGSGAFALSSLVRGLNRPYSVATGDLDGDGDVDLAVANQNSNSASILKNDGKGVFAPSSAVSVGSNPAAVAAGDFDGDGDVDLAVANQYSNNVSILKNNGNGVFIPTTVGVGNYYPAAVNAGDFDGDGDLDLAVGYGYYYSNNFFILKNNGSGAFTPTTLSVGNGPASIAAGDFDGDGDLDLAVGNSYSNNISILKNGLIAEAGANTQICSGQTGQSVTLGGNPTATNGAPPYTYKWTPTIGLNDPAVANPIATPAATTTYTVEVIDSSGAKATDKIIVAVNPCAGAVFPAPNALKVSKATNIAVTFNVAIDPATIADSTISVNASQSGLHRSSKITYDGGTKTVTFDPDSDFKPGEVVNVTLAPGVRSVAGSPIIPNNWSFTIHALQGTGAFANAAGPNVEGTQSSIAAGDFDGDGDLDLAAARYNANDLAILKNDGSGNFAIAFLPAVGRQPLSVTTGDFDQDGDPDLAVTYNAELFISVLRNAGNGNFTRTDYNTASSWSDFAAAADVDRDGDLDLVVTHTYGGKVSIFKNRGDGTFPNRVEYPFTRDADDVAVADLDNDGDLDLAVTTWDAPGLTLFENSGNGAFFKKSDITVGTNPIGVVAADLNADGFMDLAVANNTSNTVSILQNNKNWNFTPTSISSGGVKPYAVIATDPDADGHLDLAVTNNSSNIVALLHNDGSGHFTHTANLSVGSQPRYPLAGDFDGDGDVDLAVANAGSNAVSILKNGLIAEAGSNAKICFGQSGQSVTLGGNPTAANGKSPYTYKWTPATGLDNPTAANPIATLTATTEYTVEVTDAGGAKAVDKVMVTANLCSAVAAVSPVSNARNINKAANLAITFTAPIDSATLTNSTIRVNGSQSGLHRSNNITYDSATKKAIFNPARDFKPGEVVNVTLTPGIKSTSGLALASYIWSFAIQSGGASVFTNTGDIGVGYLPVSTTIGDFDGDGDLDLAVGYGYYYSNNVSILKNNGIAAFTQTPVAVGSNPASIAAGDFDGDGDLDLATANKSSGNVSILKNSGAGVFTPSSTPSVESQPASIAAGDFDGDGDLDLAVANLASSKVSILKNHGNGAFIPGSPVGVGSNPTSIAVGDFDSDKDLDLAVTNSSSNNVSILKNDGNGAFVQGSPVGVGTNPASIAAGDFDGDKDLDLAVANRGSGNVSILKNNGSGVFMPTLVAVGSNPASIAAGDFDGDGDWDLATANYFSNNLSILKNNGSGAFAPSPVTVGSNPASVAAGDFDGDGDLDLAAVNSSSNNLSILKNGLIAEAGSNTEICSGQVVPLGGNPTATNGVPPYTYKWTPTTGLDDPAAANPVAKPTTTTIYTVEVTDAKGGKATDQVTITIPVTGWSVAHIVDVDDEIFGIDQSAIADGTPRDNRGLALSPNKRFLYLGYNTPSDNRVVRKIDLSVSDPANNHGAVVAQLKLPAGTQPARDIATDDRGRVYLARGPKIEVYNPNLQTPPLHTIFGFTACEGVTARRENGILVVYATDRLDKTLERFVLVEGAGEAIASSSKAVLDGDGEVRIIGASSPRGLDIANDGTAWIADVGRSRVYRVNAAGKTVDSTGVSSAMDIAIDAARGEVYVSQFTLRTIKVLNLGTGKIKRTLTPPAADLKVDLDGETGSGALCGIDVGSCQRVYVANEQGRSLLAGNPPDSPFSNIGDDNNVKAADTDPVLVVTGSGLAKEAEVEESEEEVAVAEAAAVTSYELAQNYPNPFSPPERGFAGNPSTTIRFALPEAAEMNLKIYDIAGQLVQTLIDGVVEAGRHQVVWDGTNQHGVPVASGVYFYQLRAGEFKQVRKMSLLR